MWRFMFTSYFLITAFISIKSLLLPALFAVLLPISDFRSTLYEIVILLFGVMITFFYFSLGVFAKYYHKLKRREFIFTLHMIYLPMMIFDWFGDGTWLYQWGRLWTDLIAEPLRIITFFYEYTDFASIMLSMILSGSGYLYQTNYEKSDRMIEKKGFEAI